MTPSTPKPKVSKIKALLVGIDQYPNARERLKGCINDIKAMEAILQNMIPESQRDLRTLPNTEATLLNVKNAFRDFFGQLAEDEMGLFYYSGHGRKVTTEFKVYDKYGHNLSEALYLYPINRKEGKDQHLIDKELFFLVAEANHKSKHPFVVILDCCHSGSAMRGDESDKEDVEEITRCVPEGKEVRSPEHVFLPSIPPSEVHYISLSACQSNQEAKEVRSKQGNRGRFSLSLEKVLQNIPRDFSWMELWALVYAEMKKSRSEQIPNLEVPYADDKHRNFLGELLPPAYNTLFATFMPRHDDKWLVQSGEAHGLIQHKHIGQIVYLFPVNADPATQNNTFEARIAKVGPDTTELSSTNDLDPQVRYRVQINHLIDSAIHFTVTPGSHPEMASQWLDYIEDKNKSNLKTLYASNFSLIYQTQPEKASLQLDFTGEDQVSIFDLRKKQKALQLQHRLTTDAFAFLRDRMIEINNWHICKNLQTEKEHQEGADFSFAFSLHRQTGVQHLNLNDLQEGLHLSKPEASTARFSIAIETHSSHPLYCSILLLDDRYGISEDLFPEHTVTRDRPRGAEQYSRTKQHFESIIPFKDLLTSPQDCPQTLQFKLFVSDFKWDTQRFTQKNFPESIDRLINYRGGEVAFKYGDRWSIFDFSITVE